MIGLKQRYLGCLLGLACGDAVGAPVEFYRRGRFLPVQGMQGGGKFRLLPGEWTDDTAMALCLADSLISCGGFDPLDQMQRYWRWADEGYLSTRQHAFGLGKTVAQALMRFRRTGDPYAGSPDPMKAGNGSLMRLAPVVLWFHPDTDNAVVYAVRSSLTTHATREAVDCCRLLATVIGNALAGKSKDELLAGSAAFLTEPKVRELAEGHYRHKSREQISGTGYCVQSLEAALWCVHVTGDFPQAILMAANLGDDADTTAAITGQIAGALYGVEAIPGQWLDTLHRAELIAGFARRIHQRVERVCPGTVP
ncbi:ADP-ribosylglycohydrolase family protein [Stenotrophomonas sp. YIM B06876]|uniref:ADP-ribosylglycohydrolase family protein n=1 Tax=Stenotrophomonas sp. YIM B06876 TaxID=3060211 RepID=UPI0027394FB8|nr:ADP-ribosylglycohydrolase family protein [Stenotrophomonas sp. YIM B06876]